MQALLLHLRELQLPKSFMIFLIAFDKQRVRGRQVVRVGLHKLLQPLLHDDALQVRHSLPLFVKLCVLVVVQQAQPGARVFVGVKR